MKANRVVYQNGKYVSEKDAKISIFDSALMWGDMVFEMTRSFNQKQHKLREHLERMYVGIKILRIPMKLTIDQLEKICYETIEKNKDAFEPHDEHRLLINVSRGPLGIYSSVFDNKMEPTVIVADFPLKWTVAGMDELIENGINAVIVSQRAIPSHLMEPKIKNRSRMWYQMANIEASLFSGKNNWALLLDTDGFIAEGTGDNIFFVKNGKVYTPEPRNILIGITRNYIFDLCKELKIECIEKNLETYDAYTADESFMTATPFCLLPVTKINGLNIGNGKLGPITQKLHDQWSKNVGLDIFKQIKDYSKECIKLQNDQPTPYVFKTSEDKSD
ncbi:MAG: aminotransferase class IV [Pelagibacterales bacterium]|jgi:branched-chain amino acid aminotransferase|nr:aminotransferase class IV [Pelagibacterales bacterium]|tara:strand:- start:8051 stop:9046 length:996 start_codon:yes stop_codon:yes gene_type:complete